MNFTKDLQFNIGKLTTNVKSQVAKNNPLQNQDTRALNLWLFEERNDLSFMKTTAYHHAETNKAFVDWIKEDLTKNQHYENYTEDMEAIGYTLSTLLDKQNQLEKQYTERYQLYRRAIKSMRERERDLAELREKKSTLEERIHHLQKSNTKHKKLPDLLTELAALDIGKKETEANEFKRFIMKEAFYLRFNALQEYAEKTALIAGYGKYIVDLLDDQQHASSNCDMILADALLTVDAWAPQDKRMTVTEENVVLELDKEDNVDDDAVLLTEEEMKKKASAIASTPLPAESKEPTSPAENTTDKYYHQLYNNLSLKKQKQKHAIPHHKSYADFQSQFTNTIIGVTTDKREEDSTKQEEFNKREYYAELPPPAYSASDGYGFVASDEKKK